MRFVVVATAGNGLAAKIMAARLGAEGIVYSLRGNVDGPYPVGEVEVMVEASDEDRARELLLADEVESVFDGSWGEDEEVLPTRSRVVLVVAVVLLVLVAILVLRIYASVGPRRSAEQSVQLGALDATEGTPVGPALQ